MCDCACEEDLGERICMQWDVLAIQVSWVHTVLLHVHARVVPWPVVYPSVLGVCVEGGVRMGDCLV